MAPGTPAVPVPRAPIRLERHVGKEVETVLRAERRPVDGRVLGALPRFVKITVCVEVAVRRAIELGGVILQGMGAEPLDENLDGRGEPLRYEMVEPERRAVRPRKEWKSVSLPRLVAGDERLTIVNGRRCSRKDRDARSRRRRALRLLSL